MAFLSTGLWWAFFIPTALSFTVYTVARRNWQLATSRLKTWGMVCGWVCLVLVILTFIYSGWKGGLAVIIGATLVPLIVILAIRRILRAE